MSKKLNAVRKHLYAGIEDAGCYTSEDFKKFSREFKSMMLEQLKKVNGTDYKQNVGHYFISGFFKVDEQPYYISLSDVRYERPERINLLIRTAKDYKDYHGGTNHYVDFMTEDDVLVGRLPRA